MSSPFVHRKRVLGFYFFDLSKEGLVKQQDFAGLASHVAAQLNISEGSAEFANIRAAYLSAWDAFGKPADTDDDGAISLSDFTAAYEAFMQHPEARQMIEGINAKFFDALDLNGDGRIDQDEYLAFLSPGGISRDRAVQAFERLDRNSDGYVSRAEFTSDWFEYWNSDDRDAPGNWFFGAY